MAWWRVYNSDGEYVALLKHPEDAAALVSCLGEGTTICAEHKKALWREGAEDEPASESYDHVAEVVMRRLEKGELAPELP